MRLQSRKLDRQNRVDIFCLFAAVNRAGVSGTFSTSLVPAIFRVRRAPEFMFPIVTCLKEYLGNRSALSRSDLRP